MSLYSSSLPSFPSQTNKVDLADAVLINTMNAEIVAIATALGTNPQETRATLKARLNTALDADGSIISSNAFPDGVVTPTFASQLFYRTDNDTLYIRNATNTEWLQTGQSLSNSLFSYSGVLEAGVNSGGFLTGTALNVAITANVYQYVGTSSATFYDMLKSQFIKISGISTLKCCYLAWAGTSGAAGAGAIRLTVGSVIGSAAVTGTLSGTPYTVLPAWSNFDIDVSGLVAGETYPLLIAIRATSQFVGLGAVNVIGS